MSTTQLAVAGLIALVGPYLAFRWPVPRLFSLTCASQAVLGLFVTLLGAASGGAVPGTAFAISTVCFLLAAAGMQGRRLAIAGTVLLLAGLAWVIVTKDPAPSLIVVLTVPAICLVGMAYAPGVQTKQRIGSAPSSGRSS